MLTDQQERHFSEFKNGLKTVLGEDVFVSFIEALRLETWEDDEVVVAAQNEYSAHLITERYSEPFLVMWLKTCGPVKHLQLSGASEAITSHLRPASRKSAALMVKGSPMHKLAQKVGRFQGATEDDRSLAQRPSASVEAPKPEPAPHPQQDVPGPECAGNKHLNAKMTLDRFCVNDSNRMARMAVTRLLDGNGSPITYVYGASGRGKTHLLSAVGLEWLRRRPQDRLTFLTYDALMADVSDAVVTNGLKELRTYLHNTDILLFDDVQFLRGRKRTQEELACLIERMVQAGKTVVVAGGLSPQELAETGISSRLCDRLAGGIKVEITAPDLELRTRVATQMADRHATLTGRRLAQRHIEMIARRSKASIRELESVMRYFEIALAAKEEANQSFTDDEVRKALAEQLVNTRSGRSIDDIFNFTAEVFELAPEDMRSRSRKQLIVRARQAFCMTARKLTDEPLTAIGAMVKRDHTTVMHSVSKAEIIASTDPDFGDRISRIFEEFDQDS